MIKRLASDQFWNITSSARYGGLSGVAVASLHHVHHALTNDIPGNIAAHVIGEMSIGILAGVSLFTAVAVVQNALVRKR